MGVPPTVVSAAATDEVEIFIFAEFFVPVSRLNEQTGTYFVSYTPIFNFAVDFYRDGALLTTIVPLVLESGGQKIGAAYQYFFTIPEDQVPSSISLRLPYIEGYVFRDEGLHSGNLFSIDLNRWDNSIVSDVEIVLVPEINISIDNSPFHPATLPPRIVDGRTIMPLRAISEALNADVEWHGETRSITISAGDSTAVMTIDNTDVIITSSGQTETITLDVAPTIINGSTMIPIRFFAEFFGHDVDWDNDTRTVIIATR